MKKLALAAALVAGFALPEAVGAVTALESRLSGAQIVNEDGGAPGGAGQATIRVNESRHRVCFEIAYSGLGGKATGGFLRHGGRGETARPSVVLFAGRATSPVSGCVGEIPATTLAALREEPAGHYVDLTTRRYPRGAVRGQLRGAPAGEVREGPSSGGISRP